MSAGHIARLFDCFAPAFEFGTRVDRAVAAGEADNLAVEPLVGKMRGLIEQARAAANAAGKPREQVEAAAFAVVAWFDEIVTRNPAWWNQARPLQVELFNTNNAGNEFFEHLGNLKTGEAEAREVYYHAMLLGFVGQYYFEAANTGELAKLKELHGRQLPIAPAPTHTLREEKITPQPYAGKDPVGPRYPRRWDALLLKAGVAVAVLIPLAYLMWFLLSPARVAGPDTQALVDSVLRNYQCADLSAAVAPDAVRVTGYVSKPADLERLRSEIAAVKGVKEPSFDVAVRIWPHCEVLAMLKPLRERNQDLHAGLQLTPTTGHSDRFVDREYLVVKLTQANLEGYVYVDYYTVEGKVIHLYPNEREPGSEAKFPARSQFDIGAGGAGGNPWIRIGSPFGQELVTVITSPEPLYQGLRGDMEPAAGYLADLHKIVDAHRTDPSFLADYMVIQTEPKP